MADPNNFRWFGDQISAEIKAEMDKRLAASSIVVQKHAKRLVNVDGTGSRAKRDETGRFIKGTGGAKLIYGAEVSAPGEPPRKQTGRLLGSIVWEIVGKIARVGTNVVYGRHLETGTRKMKARPWLRRALLEQRQAIIRILTAPMKLK